MRDAYLTAGTQPSDEYSGLEAPEGCGKSPTLLHEQQPDHLLNSDNLSIYGTTRYRMLHRASCVIQYNTRHGI